MLHLNDNKTSDEGARALARLLNLTTLSLRNNEVGDEGAWALSGLANLTTLDLSGNGIGAEGARALSGLANLTTLDLSGNGIGAEGARALSGLVHLTTLDLGGNGVIDLSSLGRLQKLEKLDCSGCQEKKAPPELWDMPSLREVILYEAALPGVPKEILSRKSIILAWRDCALTTGTWKAAEAKSRTSS